MEAIGPVLLEDLDPVVVGVGHDDLLLQAEAELIRRVELSLPLTELPKLAADSHRVELKRRKSLETEMRKLDFLTNLG